MRSAVVLGAGGFLGAAVAAELAAQGVALTTVGRRPARHGPPLDIEVDLLELDLEPLCEQADVVFHLAGSGDVPRTLREPLADLRANTQTTLALLDAARRLRQPPRIVLASSAAVYGESRQVPMAETHPLAPISPYGVSKLAAEHYLAVFNRLFGVPGLAVRPFSVYGPGQRKLVVHDLAQRILAGEDPLTIAAPADLTRDFVFVADAAAAIVALARAAPAQAEPYNLASGRGTSLRELADALLEASGSDAGVQFVGERAPGNPSHWYGDAAKAAALGVTFDTTLRDGLAATIEWLRATPT
jgi:UDP-glucose 4-epimerase